MNEFLKWIGRALLGPIGGIAGSGAFLLNRLDGGNRSNALDDVWSGISSLLGLKKPLQDQVDSYTNTLTQAGPTGRDIWVAGREDTLNQRTVRDMSAAGLNPALLYGSGGNQPSINTSSSGQGSGISDLLQLALLPLQMENLRAETKRTLADAGNIEQRTRTEEFVTQLRSLALEWYPKMTQAEFDKLLADTDVAYSKHRNLESSSDLISSQKEAQDITNSYLPSKLDNEIKKISAEKDNYSSSAKLNLMRESFERIQRDFARSNNFLMSSSDSLLVVTYIANLLGLSTESISKFIKEDIPKIVDDTVELSHLGSPGGPHM